MRRTLLALFVSLSLACSAPAVPRAIDDEPYPTAAALHELGIARTCSLNNGVCHNARQYPDLRTESALFAMIGEPCNVAAERHENVHDVCEPPGDRLVVPSLGVDEAIATVTLLPVSAPAHDAESARLTMARPLDVVSGAGAEVVMRRGDARFELDGVIASVLDARTVTLNLADADDDVRAFLDDRAYPWRPTIVRVGDVNGNGVVGGEGSPMSLITPGNPARSYALLRLIDPRYGDLMPKQCRTWDDRATRAFGCWIEGLNVDGEGQVTNATALIDYRRCSFAVPKGGRCSEQAPAHCGDHQGGFKAVAAIFERSCGGGGCHIGDDPPKAGLDLSAAAARKALVGVTSTEKPDRLRVAPGDPAHSYLTCKLSDVCADRQGNRMPLGGPPLSACDIDMIRAWIASGATE